MTMRTAILAATGSSILALSLHATPVSAQAIEQEDVQGAEESQIVVIGSRRADRTVADSTVPVDVISGDALTNTGFTETNRILNTQVSSFNFPQPSITHGTYVLL